MNELESIFCKLLNCDRSSLYLNSKRPALSISQLNRLEKILKKRTQGEPLQYLIGDTDFMGITLKVSPGVLIPRPETEILVEQALEWIKTEGRSLKVLDIGTGSGNIPIALAKSSSADLLDICSVDISDECLKIACSNAKNCGVADKITFLKSDIFSCFRGNDIFDCIISNPPYVCAEEYESLARDCRHEPKSALLAQEGGFYFYRRIEEGSREYLSCGGALFLEIGDTQADGVKKIFKDTKIWQDVTFIKDFCNRDRVAVIKKVDPEQTL